MLHENKKACTLALPKPSSHLSGKFWCGKLTCKRCGSPLLVYMKMNTIVIIEVRIANLFIAFRLIKSGERITWTLFLYTHNFFGRTISQWVKSCMALNSLPQVLLNGENEKRTWLTWIVFAISYKFHLLPTDVTPGHW